MKKIIFILTIFLLAMHGCEKYPEAPINDIIITDQVEAAARPAIISGTVECPVSITKIELWIDTIENSAYPTIYDVGLKNKNFALSVAGLLPITTYYYKYVAYNSIDTVELEEKNFTTIDGTLPSITTAEVSDIKGHSAVCGGNISNDGSYDITARGVCWSTQPNPTTENDKTEQGKGRGSFTSNITNLTLNTKYYVRAYATNAKGTEYGEEKLFTTTDMPAVSTNTTTTIKATSIVCGGKITSTGRETITEYGICWSTTSPVTINNNKINCETNFTVTISGLNENTIYFVRAFATNSNGTAYGEEIKVRTLTSFLPGVTTSNVTSITTNSAVCGGNVTADGNLDVTARGVCWSTSPNPTISNNKTTNGSGTGSFTSNITGLTDGTTYYVRAYATNSKGTAYGEEKSFTTIAKTIPQITTANVTSITTNTAVCGGNVTSDGNSTITARGVCWSTSPNPTINDYKTIQTGAIGSFTSNITRLADGTTYYVRAYATNSKGTAYGEERSFTTIEGTLPNVSTNAVSSITSNSAVCGGNVTEAGNTPVTSRGVCWSTSPNPTINDNKTNNGTGTGTGSFTSNITGLTDNTTYYVRAYATNSKGTAYGEEKSFTTLLSINGHDYVDLGLPSGLKWATCNIGATTPEDYGNYYAWGETTTKASYDQSNSVTYGQQISDFSGNVTYDAARANWGSTWRMPTKAEMEELRNNCTWTWTTQNGVNGMRVTGPNGNSIFLPAAVYCLGSLRYGGVYGYYWSSTPYESGTNDAYRLYFGSGHHDVHYYYRYYGHTVRPVSD